jgi:beta-lactamase regulating signal transducer with metallopeptidase domain
MTIITAASPPVIDWLLQTTWQVCVLIGLIWIICRLFGRWLSASARYGMWMLVVVRLLVPYSPASRASIFNVVPAPVTPTATLNSLPAVSIVIPANIAPIARQQAKPSWSFRENWREALAAVWLIGAALTAGRMGVSMLRLHRAVRRADAVRDPELLAMLQHCCGQMGVRSVPPLLETAAVEGPALMGFWRPRLLLPPNLAAGLSAAEVRVIFLHELAHLKRWDIAADWLMAILQVVHWFNPMVWLAFARGRADREMARDAMVLSMTGISGEDYGQTILKLVERISGTGPWAGAVGMLEGKNDLKRRITSIARFNPKLTGSILLALVLLVVIGVLALTDRNKLTIEVFDTTNPTSPPVHQGRPVVPLPNPDRETRVTGERSVPSEANLATEQLLDRHLEVRFDQVALTDVFDHLRDISGANIFVDWRSLKAAGIEKTTPVTARLRDVKLSKLLTTILADVGGGKVKLGYHIDNGRIIVSTADGLVKDTTVAVYDIRDLLSTAPPPPDQQQALPLVDHARTDGKAGFFAFVPDSKTAELVKQLTDFITETVDRGSWIEHGGKFGDIKCLSGQLIVTQTEENHRQIVSLLDKLREPRSILIKLEAKLIGVEAKSLKDLGLDLNSFFNIKNANQVGPEQAAPAGGLAAGNPKTDAQGGRAAAGTERLRGTVLDDVQVNFLVRATKATVNGTVQGLQRITIFNGQKAHIGSAQQQAYTANFEEIKRPDGTSDYKPVVETIQSGIILNAQLTVSADRKFVTVSLSVQVSQLHALFLVPFEPAVPGKKLMIQKPDYDLSDTSTIVSMPDGETLLLKLPPMTPAGIVTKEAKERAKEQWVLLLLIKPTIIMANQK